MAGVKKNFFNSILLVFDSVSRKLIGLISTLILARVLVPEDFGLVAIATLLLGLLEVLAQTGSSQYILRADEVDNGMLNTAWSIDVIARTLLSIILILCAPLASGYYDDDRLNAILYVFATMMLVDGLKNPALNLLMREQEYKSIVKLGILAKTAAVCVGISIALIYKSYWALILGQYTATLIKTIGSYVIQPYLPSITLVNLSKQWNFSVWLIPQSLLGYFRTQLDTFLVSASFGKDQLGSYHIMKYLAFIPCAQILLPATQPLLVELSKIKDTGEHFNKHYNVTFIITMLIAMPLTFMMYIFSELIVQVFLGDNWIGYSDLFAAFALLLPAYAMFHHANRSLFVFAETKLMAYYEVFSIIVMYSFLTQSSLENLVAFANLRVSIENIISFFYFLYISIKHTTLKSCLRLLLLLIPIFASCMSAYYTSMNAHQFENAFLALCFNCSIFGATFIATLTVFHLLFRNISDEWKYLDTLVQKVLSKLVTFPPKLEP